MYFGKITEVILESKKMGVVPDLRLETMVDKAEYAKSYGYYEEWYDQLYNQVSDMINPANNEIPTEKTIKELFDYINKDRMNQYKAAKKQALANGEPFDEPEPKKIQFYALSDKEKREREELRSIAAPLVTKLSAEYQTASFMVRDFVNQNGLHSPCRHFFNMVSIDTNNTEEMMRDLCALYSENWETRKEILGRKMDKVLSLVEKINKPMDDRALLETFQNNMKELFFFAELDGNKIEQLYKDVDLEVPDDIKVRVDAVKDLSSTITLLCSRITQIANPMYPVIDERNGFEMENSFMEYMEYITEKSGRDFADYYKNTKLDENGQKIQANAISAMTGTMQFEIGFEDARKNFELDLLVSTVISKEGTVIVDKNGVTYTKDELLKAKKCTEENVTPEEKAAYKAESDKVQALLSMYDKGDSIAVMNKEGKFEYSLHIENDKSVFPAKNDFFEFNFDEPHQSVTTILNALKEVDPWYVSSHKEFKDLRRSIEALDNPKLTNVQLYEALDNIKTLADKYVESKYQNDTPEKTLRTFERENFCKKLSTSIAEVKLEKAVSIAYFNLKDTRVNEAINDDELEALDNSKDVSLDNSVESEYELVVEEENVLEQ